MSTKIAWAEKVWNPFVVCEKVSAGCANCYALPMARRLQGMAKTHGKPAHYLDVVEDGQWSGRVGVADDARWALPLRWKKPRVIFVNSMGDFFHKNVPTRLIDRALDLMAEASQHTYVILTKRPETIVPKLFGPDSGGITREMRPRFLRVRGYTLPNVWIGVSVEDQLSASLRIPELQALHGWSKFVSYEPALGPVDFTGLLDGIDGVIVGGESGAKARPFDGSWAIQTIDQCASAGVRCYFKQWGSHSAKAYQMKDPKGADPSEWASCWRVRQMPWEVGD